PQLMQLGQPQPVGAVNHDGVGRGHINAGFDNRCAQQDVVALLVKAFHDLFQFAFGHLAMRNGNARFGHQLFQFGAAVMNGVDFIMQEVHLAATLEFAQQGFTYGAVVFAAYKGFDGQALLRCGRNDGKVAYAFQRHAQGAGNGRGCERQDIDFGAQGFQGFFLAHAKPVLFVDNDQAQGLELDVFGQNLVGTDDDIDLTIIQALDG